MGRFTTGATHESTRQPSARAQSWHSTAGYRAQPVGPV